MQFSENAPLVLPCPLDTKATESEGIVTPLFRTLYPSPRSIRLFFCPPMMHTKTLRKIHTNAATTYKTQHA